MRPWPSTLRWRLTLWYTALVGVPLVALAIGYYVLFARTLDRRTDEFIGDALTAFSRELIAERRAAAGPLPAIRSTVEEVRFRDLHIAVLDSVGRLIAMTSIPAAEARAGATAEGSYEAWVGRAVESPITFAPRTLTVTTPHDAYRVLVRPVVVAGDRFLLTGTYALDDTQRVLRRIRRVLVLVLPLLVVAAATSGWFLARRSLAPLAAMASRAAEIGATNLRERLPVTGGEELAGLARVVNDLLDRLEASFGQQQRFMADASHELRTPTAIVRTEADVTLAQEHRSEEEYRTSMTVVRDAARRLTRIVDDLFALARADAGISGARHDPIYLEELVHGAMRAVRALADSRDVRVELGEVVEAPFHGDADLLGRLLLNLLDNAIKHSPRGGTVAVTMALRGGRYEIAVADQGAGIPPAERERIFERFVRLDGAAAGAGDERDERASLSGAGLGLAIARRIAEAHGGTISVADAPGRGAVFVVELPA